MGEKKSGIEQGHHGESSEAPKFGAPGSHEDTRGKQSANRRINTGHPGELERFAEEEAGKPGA